MGRADTVVAPVVIGTSTTATSSSTAEAPETTTSVETTSSVVEATAAFEIPDTLEGRWRSADGNTVLQIQGNQIIAFQAIGQVNQMSAAITLAEPAGFAVQPTRNQPVQVVMFMTAETDTSLVGPQAVLAELLITDQGLQLSFEQNGAPFSATLIPG